MPSIQVRAQGYVEHLYKIKSRENLKIVPSSFSFSVICPDYIGQSFPAQICSIRDVDFSLSNDRTFADVKLSYSCTPNNACPNFLIEFNWQEE